MRSLLFAFALLISPLSFADAWDNLTLEEAKAVVAELEQNPYIFDYCDCCDHSGEYAAQVHLLKVTKTEIITCSWNAEYYSVKFESTVLAELTYTAIGPNTKKPKKANHPEVSDLIYMNYTWGINPETKKATPFFNKITYSTYGESAPCKKEFNYPEPKKLKKVCADADYEAWFNAK